jgi:uncharacterized membrane protein YidH (DUF202 family)
MPKDDLYTHTFFGWIRTIALGIATFVVTCYLTYRLALWVDPPFVGGRHGEDHHVVMVLGQAFVALVGGFVLMIAVMILDRRHQRRKRLAVISSYTDPAPARALPKR